MSYSQFNASLSHFMMETNVKDENILKWKKKKKII